MNARKFFIGNGLLIILAVVVGVAGCTVAPRGATDDAADEGTETPAPTPVGGGADLNTVLVRFVNATSAVVETQFYTTNDPVENVPDDLFQPANLITVGVGVAGRGLLIPLSADTIEIPCTEDLLLGTTGGRFQDPDLGTELGTGPARWLEEGAVFDCGASIEFTYAEEGDEFTVDVTHETP